MITSKPSVGDPYLRTCSCNDNAGELPTTRPLTTRAPCTAAYGTPGHEPVISTPPRSAMRRPTCTSLSQAPSANGGSDEPITPTASFIVALTPPRWAACGCAHQPPAPHRFQD